MHIHTHTHVYKRIDVQIHTRMHIYTYIHIRTHTHIHIYTHTHTKCTYERTQVRLKRPRGSKRARSRCRERKLCTSLLFDAIKPHFVSPMQGLHCTHVLKHQYPSTPVEVRNKDNPGVTICTLSKSQRSWHTLEHATPIRFLLPSIYKTTKFDELL